MYSWFDPPKAGAPERYAGWNWDPAIQEWVQVDMAPIKFTVDVPKFPMPDWTPRKAQDLDVPGWYWNGREGIWKEVPIPKVIEYVEDKRPPEPDFWPRPHQDLWAEGWRWDGRAGEWIEAEMPIEIVWMTRPHPPEPTEVPSRDQPAEVLGWRFSFMYMVWEKIPMPKVAVKVRKERPPAPEFIPGTAKPSEVLGWSYSKIYEVWEKTEMPVTEVDVTPERGPKPTIGPGVAKPYDAEGWIWNSRKKEWFCKTIYAEPIEITPPLTLPPGVKMADFISELPTAEQFTVIYEQMLAAGYRPAFAAKMIDLLGMTWTDLETAKSYGAHAATARVLAERLQAERLYLSETIGLYAALIILFTAVGYAMGTILERATFPDEDSFTLRGGISTFLLGPDNWSYSRFIGLSKTGREYYSHCGDIGAGYVRHFRGHGIGQRDYIDFPGGFLEEGFVFPYYVKYVWEYWRLEYVGMLETAGNDFYVLKVPAEYEGEINPNPWIEKEEDWCPNFTYYLGK